MIIWLCLSFYVYCVPYALHASLNHTSIHPTWHLTLTHEMTLKWPNTGVRSRLLKLLMPDGLMVAWCSSIYFVSYVKFQSMDVSVSQSSQTSQTLLMYNNDQKQKSYSIVSMKNDPRLFRTRQTLIKIHKNVKYFWHSVDETTTSLDWTITDPLMIDHCESL